LALLLLTLLGSASAGPPAPSEFFLRPRDVVVFLGDSITENGRFIGYLDEYLHNYRPGDRVRLINAGWGGDRVEFGAKGSGSPGALARVERDVLAHHPTVVVVMLGMNDGRSTDASRLGEFREGMNEIIRRLRKGSRARIVLLTSTPYDVTQRPGEEAATGESVGRFARAMSDIGRTAGVPVIDLHEPMQRLVRACRERQPPVILLPDGVHPVPAGHLAIAALILRAWHAPLTLRVSALTSRGSARQQDGCEIRNCRAQQGTLFFQRRLTALPLAVPANIREALKDDLTVRRLCEDRLVVSPLTAPRYELSVDGETRAVLSRGQLVAGADLSRLPGLPDTEQAVRAAALAQEALQLRNDAWKAQQRRVAIPDPAPPASLPRRIWNKLRRLAGAPPSASPRAPSGPAVPPDLRERLPRVDRAWRDAAAPRWHQFALVPVR
jgi:lysophospholipase L1-like esterase